MQWAVDSKAHGYQFESQCNSRPAVIDNLVKHFKLQHCKPHQTTLSFPEDNLQINITRFDFVAQLFSLLTDKSLTGDITQLDVPQDNPFGMYTSPMVILDHSTLAGGTEKHMPICVHQTQMTGYVLSSMVVMRHLLVPILDVLQSHHSYSHCLYSMNH